MTNTLSPNALRALLSKAFDAALDEQCPAAWHALGRISHTCWSSKERMAMLFRSTAEYEFDARDWLGVDCGYFERDRMNAAFQRVTGWSRDELLELSGWV